MKQQLITEMQALKAEFQLIEIYIGSKQLIESNNHFQYSPQLHTHAKDLIRECILLFGRIPAWEKSAKFNSALLQLVVESHSSR